MRICYVSRVAQLTLAVSDVDLNTVLIVSHDDENMIKPSLLVFLFLGAGH